MASITVRRLNLMTVAHTHIARWTRHRRSWRAGAGMATAGGSADGVRKGGRSCGPQLKVWVRQPGAWVFRLATHKSVCFRPLRRVIKICTMRGVEISVDGLGGNSVSDLYTYVFLQVCLWTTTERPAAPSLARALL